MHMAGGGDTQGGGRGDALASCASPLGTPLPRVLYRTRAGTGSMVAFALDWISFFSALKKEYGEPVDSGASFAGKSFSCLSSVLNFFDGCWIH
jgi:hypothetical protein